MSDKRLGHLQSPQSKMPQRITLKCGDQEIQLHHHRHKMWSGRQPDPMLLEAERL